MDRDDVQLINDILDGDDTAFSDLVKKYQKSVHALAWRKVGDFHIAEEIVQDTFLQAYKKIASLNNPKQFAGWLYVIADRCCKAWFRKKQIYMQSLDTTDSEKLEQNVYSEYISKQREEEAVENRRKVVQKLLEKLPESERTVIILFYLGEMSCNEISKFLGVSPNTVKSRLSRGRERLRQEHSIVSETLGSVQLPTNLTESIMQQIDKVNRMSPQSSNPIPWVAFAATTLFVITLIGASNQFIKNYQNPYSLEENSETTIKIVDASIVRDPQPKRDLQNRIGNDTIEDRNKNNGLIEETEVIQNNLTQDPMQWNLPENVKTRFGKGRIREIEYSPDGEIVAVAGDIGIWIYDTSTYQELTMLPADATRFQSLSFVGNDRILASVGHEQVVLLWDANTGSLKKAPIQNKTEIIGGAFGLNGQTFASGNDHTIGIWDINTIKKTKPKKQKKKDADKIQSSEKMNFVNASSDNIQLFDVNTLNHKNNLDVKKQDFISTVAYSGDQTIMASGDTDHNILLWDAQTGKHEKTLSGHTSHIDSIEFSPDGKSIVSTGDDGTIRFWEVETGTLKKTITGYSVGVNSVSFSPNRKTVASTNRDGIINIWNVSSQEKEGTIIGYPDKFNFLVFNPQGQLIVCGDGKLSIWDPNSTEQKKILTEHIQGIHWLAMSPDGSTLATAHEDSKIKLWDSHSGKHKETLSEHNRRVYSVAFSPDNKTLASASDDNTIRIWDVITGKEKTILTGHTNGVKSVTFSPDGKTLASGDGNNLIILWDFTTGNIRMKIIGHDNWVFCLTYSPDGKTLASGGDDSIIKLWDANSGELKNTLLGHTNWVRSITYSPDGQTLASSSDDGTVLIWNIKHE